MTTPASSAARLLGVVTSTLALTVGTAALPSGPARAADTITAADQPYVSYYRLDELHAAGLTGEGVTIAIIDGEVDTKAPELSSTTITDKTPCTVTSSAFARTHGTAVASVIGADGYGVAPSATILSYRSSLSGQGDVSGDDCRGDFGVRKDSYASLANHAMNDGATIINMSVSSDDRDVFLKWAIARAMSQGVIIVTASGNSGRDGNSRSLAWWSGVVGVGAIDTQGAVVASSSSGDGLVSAAVSGPVTVHDYSSRQTTQVSGTSISSPLVAGFLALARQKWPEATANQLLQLLVHTGTNPDHTWNKHTGYGPIDPAAMLATDPTQFPDENPLANKGDASTPTPEEIQQYQDGVVSPFDIAFDDSYVYRGLDQSTLFDNRNPYPTHLGTSPRYHGK